MGKVILLKIDEAKTIVKYLSLINQKDIEEATNNYPHIHYSIGEIETVKKSIFEE